MLRTYLEETLIIRLDAGRPPTGTVSGTPPCTPVTMGPMGTSSGERCTNRSDPDREECDLNNIKIFRGLLALNAATGRLAPTRILDFAVSKLIEFNVHSSNNFQMLSYFSEWSLCERHKIIEH